MGLDLYAGPLTRYYSGDWQTEMQRLGALIVYTDGRAPWIGREEAKAKVERFHSRLAEKLAPYDYVLPEWNEAAGDDYATVKPDHRGREALLLWAAYIHRRDLKRPFDAPADVSTDKAYRESMGEVKYYEPHLLTLDAEIFVPAEADFALAVEAPLGGEKLVSSAQSLMNTLMWINEHSWNADSGQSDLWLERGLPHDEVFEFRVDSDGAGSPLQKILSFARRKVWAPKDRLQQAAQYGFAAYKRMLRFSLDNNVPIIADM